MELTAQSKSTNEHSLRTFAKVVLTRLENEGWIVLNPRDRTEVRDRFYQWCAKSIRTEADLAQQARDAVAGRVDSLQEHQLTESDAYKSQKRALRDSYEHQVAGFYLKTSLRDVAQYLGTFLFDCDLIEDVFADDAQIHTAIREILSRFDASQWN